MREVVIVDSVRTGLAKSFRGKFNQTRPDDMAAHCVNALLTRNDIDPASVEDCIVGAGSNEGAQGYNIGRNVAVLSRLGTHVAGMTSIVFVPRVCRRSPLPPTRLPRVAAISSSPAASSRSA